jgi:hypothetical protein
MPSAHSRTRSHWLALAAMKHQPAARTMPHGSVSLHATLPWPQRAVPIVQYGTPRTGSTFQAHLLCSAARLVDMLNATRAHDGIVKCIYAENTTVAVRLIQEFGHRIVIKMHSRPPAFCLNRRCAVFTSHRTANLLWPEAVYQQVESRLTVAPLAEISHYQASFHLSAADVDALRAYMRYWSLIRQCCGLQMSTQYRLFLHGCLNETLLAKSPDALSYPACETYNMHEVAELLTRTTLYARRTHGSGMKNASEIARQCAHSRRQIASGWDFNYQRFRNCESMAHKWNGT